MSGFPEKTVDLSLSLEEAERFRDGLSDILCIFIGVKIADPDKYAELLGVEAVRDLNIKLKSAIRQASQ